MTDPKNNYPAIILEKQGRDLSDLDKLPKWAQDLIRDMDRLAVSATKDRSRAVEDLEKLRKATEPDPWSEVSRWNRYGMSPLIAIARTSFAGHESHQNVPIYEDIAFMLKATDSTGKVHRASGSVRFNDRDGSISVEGPTFASMSISHNRDLSWFGYVRVGERDPDAAEDTRPEELVRYKLDQDWVGETADAIIAHRKSKEVTAD